MPGPKKQLVLVEWLDAWADQENFTSTFGITNTHEPYPVTTLGWILVEDELGISIACEHSTLNGQDMWRGRTFIPHAMIASITPFKLTKARPPKATPSQLPPPTTPF